MPLVEVTGSIVVVLLVHAAARSLGAAILGLVGRREPGSFDWLHIQLLGLSVLAHGALLLAALGLLRPWLLGCGLVAAAAPTVPWALGRARRSTWPEPGLEALPTVAAWGFYLSFLPRALSAVLNHDDSTYHLFLPRLYLESGTLVPRPDLLFPNMPHLVEMLSTWPMAFGDFVAPKVLAFSATGLLLAALWQWTRDRGGVAVAGIVQLAYLASKNVQWHLGPAHVEPLLALFLLGAVLSLLRWRCRGDRGDLVLCAIQAGALVGGKYPGWIFAGVLFALVVGDRVWTSGPRRAAPAAVLLASVLVLHALPWMIHAGVVTGNPVFPNLAGTFGGLSEIEVLHADRYLGALTGGTEHNRWLELLVAPVHLTVYDDYYAGPSFSVTLMAAFLASLAWAGRRGRFVAILGAAGIAAWVLVFPNGRFLLIWTPVLGLAAGDAWSRLRGRRLATIASLAVVLAAGGWQLRTQRWPYRVDLSPFTTPRSVQVTRNPTWPLVAALHRLVPPDGKVVAMWENRFFFLDRPVRYDSVFESPHLLAELRRADDVSRFASDLAADGVTHVVVHGGRMLTFLEDRYQGWSLLEERIYPAEQLARDGFLLRSFLEVELEPVESIGPYGIFRLRRGRGAGGA